MTKALARWNTVLQLAAGTWLDGAKSYISLVTTGSGAPTDLQCGSIAAWAELVAATALDGGHVLATST